MYWKLPRSVLMLKEFSQRVSNNNVEEGGEWTTLVEASRGFIESGESAINKWVNLGGFSTIEIH